MLGQHVNKTRAGTTLRLVVLAAVALITLCPTRAWAWGAAMHAYINWQARESARLEGGVSWQGLDLEAYLAAAIVPDIWYAAEEAKLTVPAGIEEDWELVRLLLAESRNVRELSWSLGYAGHIRGDVQGHKIYLSPAGNAANHLVRDSCAAFVLFGAFEGYPHYAIPTDTVIGRGLGVDKGKGGAPGSWHWSGFDEAMVALILRATDRWCATRGKGKSGCPVTAATVRGLRDYMRSTVNAFARTLTFPGYYAEASRAATNAKLVKTYDDAEFGAGGGPAKLSKGLGLSVAETRTRLFEDNEIEVWVKASRAPQSEVTRLFNGPPPAGQQGTTEPAGGAEGCTVGRAGPARWLLLVIALFLAAAARRRE